MLVRLEVRVLLELLGDRLFHLRVFAEHEQCLRTLACTDLLDLLGPDIVGLHNEGLIKLVKRRMQLHEVLHFFRQARLDNGGL
jgi:hypothetical protein